MEEIINKTIIYKMTNELLNKGYFPMLYTDYNYYSSNKAYKNVGYIDGVY